MIHLIFLSVLLTLNLYIETSSWSIRSESKVQTQGLFNSRANIYLYTSRVFFLIYMLIMASRIDAGNSAKHVFKDVIGSLTIAMLFHIVYFLSFNFRSHLDLFNLRILHLQVHLIRPAPRFVKAEQKLFMWSSLATCFLTSGITLPFVVASVFPQHRMTISSLSQVINAFGTVILLFSVDGYMFQRMDRGDLNSIIGNYIAGRAAGLALSTLIAIVAFLSVYGRQALTSELLGR